MHTKEPWTFGHKDGDVEPIVAGGVVIAEIIPTGCSREEFEANCSLIVRAPLLFATLEAWAFADADPAAARRKGYYDDARRERDALLRQLGSKAVRP
jgi:hypothetical protein